MLVEVFLQFNADFAANSPYWVVLWVNLMFVLLVPVIAFNFVYREASWIFLGLVLGFAGTLVVYRLFGFTRLLGIGHILFWLPTLIYMVTVRGRKTYEHTLFSRWLLLASWVIGISLAFDVVDLLRWILGERGLIEA